jgi:murein DD-endopeptidase MepM/ murein hydrolase activator NlpD
LAPVSLPETVRRCCRFAVCFLIVAAGLSAASVSQMTLGNVAQEDSCVVSGSSAAFDSATPQIFLRFVLSQVRAGDQVTVEWIDPAGRLSSSVPYDQLPAAPSLCLISQLPVGGFAPAQYPGAWTVRIVARGAVVQSRQFRITGDVTSPVRIVRVSTKELNAREAELTVEGEGFNTESTIHLAQYTKAGGWTYLAHLFPASLDPSRMTVTVGALPPAEYVVFVRNGPTVLSPPARFLIATTGGYRLPFPPQEQWMVSQGPYGSYSHWGRTLHAYDIAPRAGSCVVAMRGGTAHVYDFGLGQTPHRRIFGNYITIDHGDGEYSHYAHLRARSFRVRSGERVEQGQALAIVGNSGYSFGTHVHVQVTKSFAISSQSIPFYFEELPARRGFRGAITSINHSPYGDCNGAKPNIPTFLTSANGQSAAAPAIPPTWTGQVAVAAWWSELTTVPQGAKQLHVKLGWASEQHDFDLHLMSPSGRHYSTYADATGYTGGANSKSFQIPAPEPGIWRVSVQGTRGNGESMSFSVYVNPSSPAGLRASAGRGSASAP